WFKEHCYYLEDSYRPQDRTEGFKRATEKDRLPLGVFYINPKKTFEENVGIYKDDDRPLYQREPDIERLCRLIESFKSEK
ncbi:MAG: 2-oxoacid ferredoxin oxidoreductase, partial [Planctomycetota bacterium]